jgi:hypothetical protein
MGFLGGNRGRACRQGLSVENLSQFEQRAEGNTRTRFVLQALAKDGIEHPRGDAEDRTIGQLDQVTVTRQPPEAAHNADFFVVIGMMRVANPDCGC